MTDLALPRSSRLSVRLALCFGLSILLHALLLLAFNAANRNGNGGHTRDAHVEWNALTVRIESPKTDKKIFSSVAKAIATAPLAVRPEQASKPAAAQVKNLLPGLLTTLPPPPSAAEMRYQTQMNYQQMQAMHAQQMAREQQRFAISNLQAGIEQRLNQRNPHAKGRCAWRENKTLRCQPEALEFKLRPELGSLIALRDAMRMQEMSMDGFIIDNKDGRSAINYLVRAAKMQD